MSDALNNSIPLADSGETASGEPQEVRWEIVARTMGLLPATIIAGRLQSENIPARAWQESAGQALGLVYGPMGNGHVAVPAEYVERALAILQDEYDEEE